MEIIERDVTTARGRVHVRQSAPGGAGPADPARTGGAGPADPARTGGAGPADPAEVGHLGTVVLVHGNCSSSAFFHHLLGRLPDGWRGLAPDLRGFGDSEPLPVDATRGMRDFSDDLAALLDTLGITRAAFVAHSAGAGAVMQLAIDRPDLVGPVLLEAPMSPYGFGGTAGPEGRPCWPDFAGSGGGTANPEFVAALAAGERGAARASSPLSVFRSLYVVPGTALEDEDLLLDSVLSTRTGEHHYPGPAVPSANWPGTAPGTTGMNNALSPRYFDVSAFAGAVGVGPVTWVRGDADAIVSDTSLLDIGHLGAMGAVPGWPGEEAYPAQPMVTQTRAVLDRYAAAGGAYEEIVLPGVGHSPHLEDPNRFAEILARALA